MNRKRVLWPLLLVGAFGLGVLVAQVQAASIFLPLVVRASTGQETPTPTPSGTVRVVSIHYDALEEMFYGELVNETTCTVRAGEVIVYLLDAYGLPVTNLTITPMPVIMAPGERTPFSVHWFGIPRAWASYNTWLRWDPIDRLTVESAELVEGEYPDWQVTATVRNQLPVRVQSLQVGAVLYGASGEIIGHNDPARDLGRLDPGGVLTVTLPFSSRNWDATIEPVSCAVFAIPCGGGR